MRVTYWSDFSCPYCYIGETRLFKAIESLGIGNEVEVEMRAFELNPDASYEVTGTTLDRFASKYGLSDAAATKHIEDINKMGRGEGIDFNYDTTLYTNMLDAHRLTKLAHSHENTRFEELCYEAYFVKNEVMADHDVLRRLADEAGLPAADVERVLASDEYEAEVRADERDAYAMGVYSVPFFVVDGKYKMSGCFSIDEITRMLEKAHAEVPAEDAVHAWGVKTRECGTVW